MNPETRTLPFRAFVSCTRCQLCPAGNSMMGGIKPGGKTVFEFMGRGQCASAVAKTRTRSCDKPCSSAARGVRPSSAMEGDSKKAKSCQPSVVCNCFGKCCKTGHTEGSNCQRGNLKPRRKCVTPMQRPDLIQALIVTRDVPASAAASSVVSISAVSMRSRLNCAPERSTAAVCAAVA